MDAVQLGADVMHAHVVAAVPPVLHARLYLRIYGSWAESMRHLRGLFFNYGNLACLSQEKVLYPENLYTI